jgi:hypothetical protein
MTLQEAKTQICDWYDGYVSDYHDHSGGPFEKRKKELEKMEAEFSEIANIICTITPEEWEEFRKRAEKKAAAK